ncbi:4-alpha-glucanotransferase [Streptomyces sp. ISL-10]|uniref:4-alpha-glucanotransferase n=1 Tax=Streptomyces sp. ISL-10 TaxID=2819172 RepID=UPI001BE60648|nr:4-alpha-glucanotransferase [Streptomyces sp. ISL-10]MBT2368407.1 4-alpha-glucanotransferase [Streptomyces sp. ISL-10]
MGLARLAALHGVATTFEPSEGVTVVVPEATVVAVLASLGVDASTPHAIGAALDRADRAAASRLLPSTAVVWQEPGGPRLPAALGALPAGTVLRVTTEQGHDMRLSPPGARRVAPTPASAPASFRAPGSAPGPAAPAETANAPAPVKAAGAPAPMEAAGAPAPMEAPGAPAPAEVAGAPAPAEVASAPPETASAHAPAETGWGELPTGVHRLRAEAPGGRTADATLVVAPGEVPRPQGRSYGFLVQLYSLLSARSWGMGDLGDLAELAAWSGRALGASFVQVNPLHAAVPGAPTDPSPYRPSSRRFPDPVHLRVEDVPEYAYAHPAQRARLEELREKAAELRESVLGKGALIDRDAVWELKREALEILHTVPLGPGRHAAYCDFLAEQGPALEDHATWCALAEVHGSEWHSWPAALRDPRSSETARAKSELMDRVDFHSRLVWLTDEQLAAAGRAAREAGMGVGVVHDLAVGVHPGGADAWAQQAVFAAGMSVGAPPDAFNARGQDWGLPPWRPDALAASAFAPYRGLLRGILRNAGALRIDHVMGLFRLWWVPQGAPPTEGTYVRYDAEAMLAVLVLEAHRAGAVVIGEDLGTVEPGVREALADRGVLGTSVLWFERDWAGSGRPLPPESWREGCVATATTHDLPSTAARLSGGHVELRHRLGLLTRGLEQERTEDTADVQEWLGLLERLGLLPEGGGDEEAGIRAVYRFLLHTPARMVGVWLPDAIGDLRPQNLPGTWDEYPNWRLPVADGEGRPTALEDLAASPRLHRFMTVFASARGGDGSSTAPPGARP